VRAGGDSRSWYPDRFASYKGGSKELIDALQSQRQSHGWRCTDPAGAGKVVLCERM